VGPFFEKAIPKQGETIKENAFQYEISKTSITNLNKIGSNIKPTGKGWPTYKKCEAQRNLGTRDGKKPAKLSIARNLLETIKRKVKMIARITIREFLM